jgi:hypothetical protein
MQEALDRLKLLENELQEVDPLVWKQIEIWGSKALPTIVKHCVEHTDEFKNLLKEPSYPALSMVVSRRPERGGARYIFSPERYEVDHAKWAESERRNKQQNESTAAAHRQNCKAAHERILALLSGIIHEMSSPAAVSNASTPVFDYVNLQRIDELRSISNAEFNLSKLVRICEEINICSSGRAHFATLMLVRSVLDHIPPIFGCGTFSEVANNHNGGKSFKKAMRRLNDSARQFADSYLHSQIRRSESLPNQTQVKFDSELDVLLSEVCRVLKQ